MTDSDKPREVAAQLLRLAEGSDDATSRVVAHYSVGFTAHVVGEFDEARGHLEKGVGLYSVDDRDTAAVYRFGQDPGVACRCYLGLAAWALGYPDKATAIAQDAAALAQSLDDPFSEAFSLAITSFLDQARGDTEATAERASKAVCLSEEKGYPYWNSLGKVMQAWVEATNNPTGATIRELRMRIEHHRALGTELFLPYFHTLLADVALRAKQGEECLAALDEAEKLLNRTGERWWESEVYRLRGTICATMQGDPAEVEDYFKQSIAIARVKDAKSFELRATMSLARLRQRQGRVEAAHETLANIYEWFTEGFDTADLKEASKLLDELSASPQLQHTRVE